MCLYVHKAYHRGFNPSPIIAGKDEHVYKIILTNGKEYITPYQFTKLIFIDDISISYALLKPVQHCFYTIVNEGIHAFITRQRALFSGGIISRKSSNIIFCNAIIPKGTKYFIGTDDDIVSEKLIIFRTEEAFKKYMLKE